jgi:hypothetical protein
MFTVETTPDAGRPAGAVHDRLNATPGEATTRLGVRPETRTTSI